MAKIGRPPAIKSPDDLDKAINEYFAQCYADDDIFTIIGLCVYMGVSKDTMNVYSKMPEFSDSYKKAMSLAEKALVNGSLTGKYNAAVSIFMLKNNYGYKDKQETEHSGAVGVTFQIDTSAADEDTEV